MERSKSLACSVGGAYGERLVLVGVVRVTLRRARVHLLRMPAALGTDCGTAVFLVGLGWTKRITRQNEVKAKACAILVRVKAIKTASFTFPVARRTGDRE